MTTLLPYLWQPSDVDRRVAGLKSRYTAAFVVVALFSCVVASILASGEAFAQQAPEEEVGPVVTQESAVAQETMAMQEAAPVVFEEPAPTPTVTWSVVTITDGVYAEPVVVEPPVESSPPPVGEGPVGVPPVEEAPPVAETPPAEEVPPADTIPTVPEPEPVPEQPDGSAAPPPSDTAPPPLPAEQQPDTQPVPQPASGGSAPAVPTHTTQSSPPPPAPIVFEESKPIPPVPQTGNVRETSLGPAPGVFESDPIAVAVQTTMYALQDTLSDAWEAFTSPSADTGFTGAEREPLEEAPQQPLFPSLPPVGGSSFSLSGSGGEAGLGGGFAPLLLCILASALIVLRLNSRFHWALWDLPKPSSALLSPLERPG